MAGNYEMDMTHGPLFGKIVKFSIPLILSAVLQLLFNAADIIVVGRFSGSEALAAVGSTTSLINLLVNLFIGVSIGTNVMAARFYGSKNEKEMQETVHTAIYMAMVGGVFMIFFGNALTRPILILMGSPSEVLPLSVLYMRIYFLGMPALMLYNFGAAILRAVGDTRRPLYFLTFSGVINVLLNLCFVIGFRMGVVGVAIATISAQYISAILVIRCLNKSEGMYHLDFKKIRIHKDKMVFMLKIGLPAGLQSTLFNVANVMIQSSVNSLGAIAMAGNAAAANIEGFIYVSLNSVSQTSLNFIGQNMGAGKYKRVDWTIIDCMIINLIMGLVLGFGAYLLGEPLLSIYSSDAEVIAYGLVRLGIVAVSYALCGAMDLMGNSMRGIGFSMLPTIVTLTGACLIRIVWVLTIFSQFHSAKILYLSYPVSWALTAGIHIICYLLLRKRKFGGQNSEIL